MTIKAINNAGKVIKGSKVMIMGLTYKENVPDIRETPAKGIIKELKEYGVDVYGYDPLLDVSDIKEEFNLNFITSLKDINNNKMDAVIVAVAHKVFLKLKLNDLKQLQNSHPILIDIRRIFDKAEANQEGFIYMAL
jgi:UDP-N-acetyl-D-mannosaminuronate dehydrogenase